MCENHIFAMTSSSPGASSKSRSPPTLSHLRLLVTPGFGALSQTRLFRNLLIKADLPTLGKPMTAALTGRGCSPLALRLSLMLLLSNSAALVTCMIYVWYTYGICTVYAWYMQSCNDKPEQYATTAVGMMMGAVLHASSHCMSRV